MLYAGVPAGVSGTPTLTTLRMGETIDVTSLTRDSFGDPDNINSIALASSNTSIFSVNQTLADGAHGTAAATLLGLAPGAAKLVQVSTSGATPYEQLNVVVLDASRIAIIQGAYAITHNPLATVEFDELNSIITLRGDLAEDPIISLLGVPVDVRHALGAAEPNYGVTDVVWSSVHGAVEFLQYGTTSTPLTTPSLGISLHVDFDLFPAISGVETVNVQARNSSGQLITGTVTVRVRFGATVESALAT